MIYTILIVILCIVADQLTKLWTLSSLAGTEGMKIIPNILEFTYVENRGAAFGILADSRWVFMVLSVVAIVALVIYLIKAKPQSLLLRTALSLIVGGGIGNMIDRSFRGFVVDFISVPFVWDYVFNVADMAVCIGCAVLFLWLILSEIKERKGKKNESLE